MKVYAYMVTPSIQNYLQPPKKMIGSRIEQIQYTTNHIYHMETIKITAITLKRCPYKLRGSYQPQKSEI